MQILITCSNLFSGYTAAIVAGLCPSLAKSVVLMNSAGNIVPGYSPLGSSEVRNAQPYCQLIFCNRLFSELVEFLINILVFWDAC